MKKIIVQSRGVIFFVLFFCTLAVSWGSAQGERVLFDFETDKELDGLQWQCNTLLSLSPEHRTHGSQSLRVEFYPSGYPGLQAALGGEDWSTYKALCFDVYNPDEEAVLILVRVDDCKWYPSSPDCYKKAFVLKTGMNQINIPLNTIATARAHQPLNFKTIHRFFILMEHPQNKHLLYIDYVRLVQ